MNILHASYGGKFVAISTDEIAREGHDVAWEFAGRGGSYTGRMLVDGELYTPSEATKKFLQTGKKITRHENRELIIRQLLPSVREKTEFLRMSLMKIPGHAPDLI
jgi:hypothetical protein